jgi:DNA-directed RNA polymerase specialized sigma24 family protein
MIERFFDELRRSVGAGADNATDPPELNKELHSQNGANDESFLAAVPTIRKIVWRRLFSAKRDEAPDLVQNVILQLLTWRKNNPNKIEQMSKDEWQAFASKATFREVNRQSSSDENLTEQLNESDEIPGDFPIAGTTAAEVASLTSGFWQGICQLSLRQRRALLLGSESLIVILRQNGIGNREISDLLELDNEKLAELIDRLPLKDVQIAHLIAATGDDRGKAKNRNINSLTNSIKKARHEARAKLQKLISE